MSTSTTNELLWKLREAVLKNTCRPIGDEIDPVDMKSIRVSATKEGDSQLGLTLFVGVANELGFDTEEICSAEGLEPDEVVFKLNKFKQKLKENSDKRFVAKVLLVRNYLKLM